MKVLKSFAYKLFCNNITGALITFFYKNGIPDLRWKGYTFFIDKKLVKGEMIAAIFFGFYEKAEIKFIEKYLHGNLDVLEFGSSIGIVSCHIANKLVAGRKLIMLEANPNLETLIKRNVERYISDKASYNIIHKAISYTAATIGFKVEINNTDSHIVRRSEVDNSVITVKTISLSEILKENDIKEYSIVCDIEGAEVEWLLNESESIEKCKQLLIELHEIYSDKLYSIEDLKDIIITKHHFKLIERRGPVFYFEK